MVYSLLLLSAVLTSPAPGPHAATAQSIDSDRDGISDQQEQLLLERFRPAFMVSKTDCAFRPAKFEPDEINPKPLAADGTIYGQVFPVADNRIEVHYYTLWGRDCGRMKHPLDAEHVSVLLSIDAQGDPKELYWYAGAHEKTSCDMSSGARVEALTRPRPVIWSSSGKHALYFRQDLCGHGCGADSCKDDIELRQDGPVINIGELERPMNGSSWVKSSAWPLSDKMDSDFSAEVISRLTAAPEGTISTLRGNRTMRGTIDGADAALNGAAIGAHDSGAALDTAHDHTSRSLGTAARATGRALNRAWHSLSPKKEKTPPR